MSTTSCSPGFNPRAFIAPRMSWRNQNLLLCQNIQNMPGKSRINRICQTTIRTLLYPSLCWNDAETDQYKEPMIDTKIIQMGKKTVILRMKILEGTYDNLDGQ